MTRVQSVVRGVTILNVSSRLVSNGTKTIWDVLTDDNSTFTTFNAPLGNKVLGFKGMICDLQITIDGPNDRGFTNYYLEGAQLAQGVTQPSPVAQAANIAQGAAQTTPEVTYEQYKDITLEQEQRKNTSIHRQTAAKVAAALLPESSQEFWTNVNDLVTFFATGTNMFFNSEMAKVPDAEPGTPFEQGAAQDANTDDDIPF